MGLQPKKEVYHSEQPRANHRDDLGNKATFGRAGLRSSASQSRIEGSKPIQRQGVRMVAQELLEILRCPHCVSGPTRRPGEDPGRLTIVRDVWLVCQEPDCGRKYPIVDDIPVMLIDTGDKWISTAVEDLPVPPPQP
jgi:uncharacterized protein